MSKRRLLALITFTLAAGCSQELPATGCRSDAQCAAQSRCTSGVCTADARPVAAIRPLGALQEFELVELDGSGSQDDDGDIVEHVWTVRGLDAGCEAPAVSGRTASALVRFGCPGRYEVSLTVRDVLGLASEPASTELTVQPSSGSTVVRAGEDRATGHVCGASPLRCRNASVIQLEAEAVPGVALRWSVVPPIDRPLDGSRQVRFIPDDSVPRPQAVIETDGASISGDWVFRVEVVDGHGVVGAAHQRVTVANRPPVVSFAPPGPFEHAFDPARSAFTALGAVAWSVFDPDGDPVAVSGNWRHVGDGDLSLFDGDFDGSAVTFHVDVPYAAPEDALKLRGGADLLREIELVAVDANREVVRQAFRVEIGNRPPVAAGGAYQATVPHRFDAARSLYVADVRVGTFVDPDGDPLVDSTGGQGPCGTFRVDGNEVTAECAVPFAGVPAVDELAGRRTFPVAPHDPWEAAAVVPIHTVEIQNSPPRFAVTPVPSVANSCMWGYTRPIPCFIDFVTAAVEFDVSVDAEDPDGDPLLVVPLTQPGGTTVPSATVTAGPGVLPFHFAQPSFVLACARSLVGPLSFVEATDGAESTRVPVSPALRTCD